MYIQHFQKVQDIKLSIPHLYFLLLIINTWWTTWKMTANLAYTNSDEEL